MKLHHVASILFVFVSVETCATGLNVHGSTWGTFSSLLAGFLVLAFAVGLWRTK